MEVTREKRNPWTYQRISSIIIVFLAVIGLAYSVNSVVVFYQQNQENKELKRQKEQLLEEFELYQALISDNTYDMEIYQKDGYCIDLNSKTVYKCE